MPKYHIYNEDGTMSHVSRSVFFESIYEYYIIDADGTRCRVSREEYEAAKKKKQRAEKTQIYWVCAEFDDYGKITEDSAPFLLPKTEAFRGLYLAYMQQHLVAKRRRLRLLKSMRNLYGEDFSLFEQSLDNAAEDRQYDVSDELDVIETVEDKLLCEQIHSVVLSLSEAQRELIIAHFLEGKSEEQIGQSLHISQQAVSKRLKKTLTKLLEIFS